MDRITVTGFRWAPPFAQGGIKNCDTMKKARAWLDGRGGIEHGVLDAWAREVGWATLLSRAGTTFEAQPGKGKEGLTARTAIALMAAHLSMIKRPVLDIGGRLLVGFSRSRMRRRSARGTDRRRRGRI